ncbi:MAG: SDR family oxidoreductase [Eubacterium sp.]|nr:SDR family oxidoreductase [Eubacterium sp.]
MANAIITGARKGIGRAVAEEFASHGINIWACYSSENPDFSDDMKLLSEKYNVWIKPVIFDLRDEEAVKKACKEIISEKIPIDILVNNAGVPGGGLMQMTSVSSLREVMEVNFISQILITQLISKYMARKGGGSIVNMGSIGGIEAREGYLSYGSSKAALMWATRCISKELAKYNIRVNAVAPGLVETDMGNFKSDEERDKILNSISMKRMGTPEEIAKAVYFLASEDASFITGTVLLADGGRLI